MITVILTICCFLLIFYCIYKQNKYTKDFDKRMNVVYDQLSISFKEKLDEACKSLMRDFKNKINEIENERKKENTVVEKLKSSFEEKVKDAYEKAVEKIDFDRVEYKKVIQTKRKAFARKNPAKPKSSSWRNLTDE
jgi:predicted Holliday junction resolvase-like endonuclease